MRALVATLYNEADNVEQWLNCLRRQSVSPDEMAIIDGGSTDGTWEKLQAFQAQSPVSVKLDRRRCNIAEGRNLAIQLTKADIIGACDASSFPEEHWFAEITQPLLENPSVDVVGGDNQEVYENDFQKSIERLTTTYPPPTKSEEIDPSSRNIAFRRQAWQEVGGYPEWLTLTAEDSLFNFELHKIGKQFAYNPKAIVRWPVRETPEAYFKMLYSYGYGAAEARLYTANYLRTLTISLFPPLLLLSRHRFHRFAFRYRKNLSSTLGWLAGKMKGKRAPKDWKQVEAIYLSPEAQESWRRRSQVSGRQTS
jgi:glycosyltransferase involved in cell wall biosynthesis